MKTVKVKDEPGFVRDLNTNAVISTDNPALEAYKKAKQKNREFKDLQNDVEELKSSMINIERMLTKLLEK